MKKHRNKKSTNVDFYRLFDIMELDKIHYEVYER